MPTVTETAKTLYAHCTDPRCPGAAQRELDGFVVETAFSYRERGANAPGIEQSTVTFRLADEDQHACECGRRLELSDQRRVIYDNLSGHDPMGLLGVPQFSQAKQVELRQQPMTDDERERLEAEVRARDEQLADLADRLKKLEAA